MSKAQFQRRHLKRVLPKKEFRICFYYLFLKLNETLITIEIKSKAGDLNKIDINCHFWLVGTDMSNIPPITFYNIKGN